MKEKFRDIVEKATVTLPGKSGQGVLVSGNLILTAAHCIDFKCEGEMALGDYFIEKIKTGEKELKVTPLAVEPVSDLAVLGSLDEPGFGKEAEDFEKFCEHTKPVPLCRRDFVLTRKFSVHVYTHKGTWLTGKAMQLREDCQTLFVETDDQIEGGTSGGPIINDSGDLVGIVSNFSDCGEADRKSYGPAPLPHLALPVWVCRRIENEEKHRNKRRKIHVRPGEDYGLAGLQAIADRFEEERKKDK